MPTTPFSLPSSFASQHPVLLFPVRVQVKFVRDGYSPFELRVRFYPDQLGLSTHEKGLTPAEVAAGQHYWQQASPTAHSLEYWRPLVATYGVPRARWILKQTAPGNTPKQQDSGWSRAAHSLVMPSRFSVALYNTIIDPAHLPDHVREQLLAGGQRPYDPATIQNPTSEFLEQVRLEHGKPIAPKPLPVGFDPHSKEEGGVTGLDAQNLWTVEFDKALDNGMALVIPLTEDEFKQGFKRLVVLGVHEAAPNESKVLLEQVLSDHAYTDGLALVPQGTPTNNTETGSTGYSAFDTYDADGSFALLQQQGLFEPAAGPADQPDGQRLTEALGIQPAAIGPVAHARATDTSDAQRLNKALWPATYGYFLEEMLRPLLSSDTLKKVREFFQTYVLARGPVPAFRVGAEPYGVLPTTRFSAWRTLDTFGQQLADVLRQLDVTWTERLNPQPGLYQRQIGGSTPVQFPEAPANQQDLLTTLAADATSVEYYQRYLLGPVFTDSLNHSLPTGVPPIWTDTERKEGRFGTATAPENPLYSEFRQLLDPTNALQLPTGWPRIFDQTFQTTFTKLAESFADEPAERRGLGCLIDEQPLSEEKPVAPFPGLNAAHQGWNYIQWLAKKSFDDIRLERFEAIIGDGSAFAAPTSLLYRLLRQAVLLQYWEAAKDYHQLSGKQSEEKELFNINTAGTTDTARWEYLYKRTPDGQLVHEYLRETPALKEFLANLETLATFSTAHLERLLAEHLDVGSYRIDAWKIAQVTERLTQLRQQDATKQGAYLGAFAWLEDVQAQDRSEIEVGQQERFDPDNLGYIHAPSLGHGTAAAILRQGYKSRQLTTDETDPAANRMAVNLSSRRVRKALAVLEGLRLGHSLGVVLGQEFERSLLQSEATTAAGKPYGSFIAEFRKVFSIADEQALSGEAPTPNSAAEASSRQVVDGVALLRATPKGYPYGVISLPATDEGFRAFLAEQLASLTDTLDALGDLSVSEGVYQAAQGNMERATAILESVAKGQFPVNPEVVHPPHRGNTLTHRVLVHLPTDTTLGSWPEQDTPRAQLEPRLNAWLAQFFPLPTTVEIGFGYKQPGEAEWSSTGALTLDEVGLHPIDLLNLLDGSALQANSAFDVLVRRVIQARPLQVMAEAGTELVVNYESTGMQALRRLLPLLNRLRQLLASSRPALPNDLKAPSLLSAQEASQPHAGVLPDQLQERLSVSLAALQAVAVALPVLTSETTPAQAARALTSAETTAASQALLFGLSEAAAVLATPTVASAAVLRTAVEKRLAGAQVALGAAAALDHIEAGKARVSEAEGPDVEKYVEAAQALFGPTFRMGVEFTLSTEPDTRVDPAGPSPSARYAEATTPAVAADLLRNNPNPLCMQEWLQGLACVRDTLDHLDKVLLLQDVVADDAAPRPELRPTQLSAPRPVNPDEPVRQVTPYWLGQEWPEGYAPPGDAISLVQWLPENYNPAGSQYALWLDEWTETLPDPEETTALTFHYDQPNNEAAQTLLLVVAPDTTSPGWNGEDLLGAVNETLDLAKKRTVEPDALAFTHLGSLLPAVVAPVAQQAVTFTLDFGRVLPNPEDHRFRELPLS